MVRHLDGQTAKQSECRNSSHHPSERVGENCSLGVLREGECRVYRRRLFLERFFRFCGLVETEEFLGEIQGVGQNGRGSELGVAGSHDAEASAASSKEVGAGREMRSENKNKRCVKMERAD